MTTKEQLIEKREKERNNNHSADTEIDDIIQEFIADLKSLEWDVVEISKIELEILKEKARKYDDLCK